MADAKKFGRMTPEEKKAAVARATRLLQPFTEALAAHLSSLPDPLPKRPRQVCPVYHRACYACEGPCVRKKRV